LEIGALLWLTARLALLRLLWLLHMLLRRSLHLGLHLLLLLWLLLQLGLHLLLHWLALHMLDILNILHLVLRWRCNLVRVLHLLHLQMRLALLCHLGPLAMPFWSIERVNAGGVQGCRL
jgi:hypothetical protein